MMFLGLSSLIVAEKGLSVRFWCGDSDRAPVVFCNAGVDVHLLGCFG